MFWFISGGYRIGRRTEGREGEGGRRAEGGGALDRGTVRGSMLYFYQAPLESEKPQLLYSHVRLVTITKIHSMLLINLYRMTHLNICRAEESVLISEVS